MQTFSTLTRATVAAIAVAAVALVVCALIPARQAHAVTAIDAALYPWYNPEFKAAKCGAGTSTLEGNVNEEKIWNYFAAKGMNPIHIAAIMGNMQAESGFKSNIVQGGGTSDTPTPNVGFGLSQWTPSSRQKLLVDRAAAAGVKPSDLAVQLDYIWWELTSTESSYKRVGDHLFAVSPTGANALSDATNVYLREYEAPLVPNLTERLGFAQNVLTKFGSSTISASGTPVLGAEDYICGTQSGTGSLVGSFSLPVDKKWYDQNKTWFTKPHHDYPAADIPVPSGTPVYAVAGGTITSAPMGTASTGYGLGVEINAGNGVIFIYGHGSDGGSVAGAHEGDTVQAGQLIMHSGNTGHSTGPHLHLEIRVNGKQVCPQEFLDALGQGKTPPDVSTLPTSGCTN